MLMRRLLPAPGATRLLAVAILVTTLGNGMYVAGSVLFFTRSIGLRPSQVGLGLTFAGLVGLASGPAVGHLADRFRARNVYVTTLTGEGLATGSLALVHGFGTFLASACLISIAEQGSRAVRGALIARAAGEDRAQFRSYLRTVTNVGLSVGAACAGVAIRLGTRDAYLCLVLGDALSFFLTAVVIMRLPRYRPLPSPAGDSSAVLAIRDLPYLGITALYGVLSMQYVVLTVVLPLWITAQTSAPRWLVSPAILLNTVLVVLLQIRVGRRVDSVEKGSKITRLSSLFFAGSCLLYATTHDMPGWAVCAVLLLAVLVHTLGEMSQAAGEFELSFELAPDHAQGQYQGVFSLGRGACMALAPALLTLLCVDIGQPGWLVLAVVFLAAGLLIAPAARWAESR